MKIVAALLACLTATRAQRVLIGYPPEGANLTAGHTTTIEIQRPVGCVVLLESAAYLSALEFPIVIGRSSDCAWDHVLPQYSLPSAC